MQKTIDKPSSRIYSNWKHLKGQKKQQKSMNLPFANSVVWGSKTNNQRNHMGLYGHGAD